MKKTILIYAVCSVIVTNTLSGCATRSFQDDDHICSTVAKIQRMQDMGYDDSLAMSNRERALLKEYSSYCFKQTRNSRSDYRQVQQLGTEIDSLDRRVDSLLHEGDTLFLNKY